MKVNKLKIAYEFEFDLVGIVSNAKDFKLAWSVNQVFDIELIRDEDHVLYYQNDNKITFSYYSFHTEHTSFRLFKNRSLSSGSGLGYLIPELKQMDYFLVLEGDEITERLDNFIALLNKSKVVNTALKVDVIKLKSKENLLV